MVTNAAEICPGNDISSASILKSTMRPDKLDIQFDHLSVVSEECLSNSDEQSEQQRRIQQQTRTKSNISVVMTPTLLSDVDNFVPEKSAVLLFADFQSTVPPLTHFENLSYSDIGPNVGKLLSDLLCVFLYFYFPPRLRATNIAFNSKITNHTSRTDNSDSHSPISQCAISIVNRRCIGWTAVYE